MPSPAFLLGLPQTNQMQSSRDVQRGTLGEGSVSTGVKDAVSEATGRLDGCEEQQNRSLPVEEGGSLTGGGL